MLQKLRTVLHKRIPGVPRTLAEVNYSLQMLSWMRGLGWHGSIRKEQPVDREGKPIPWYTYAALEWLSPRVGKTDVVFEYGSGNSTIWYGQRTERVIAVEHDRRWSDQVRSKAGNNVTVLLRSTLGSEGTSNGTSNGESPYCKCLEEYPLNSFDIIVIDGVERVQCARVAPLRLRDDGIIIFDNSDRTEYRSGIEHLHKQGFGRIDFYGSTPVFGTRSCTSIFSKFGTRWTAENVHLVFQGW